MADDTVHTIHGLPGYRDEEVRIPDHSGEPYIAVLERFHKYMCPKAYFEVGAQSGQSLALARCSSIAVDPDFRISTNVFSGKRSCHLFQMGSDEFFSQYDPTQILGGKIDFAFLDGMHWFEFLLRDFINTERHAKINSVIALHDCVPLDVYSVRRNIHDNANRDISQHPEWWAGDVWKTLHILQRFRPDLKIYVFDAPPTGLVLITRLDPGNDILSRSYFQIIEEMQQLSLLDIGVSKSCAGLAIRPTSSLTNYSDFSELFWL